MCQEQVYRGSDPKPRQVGTICAHKDKTPKASTALGVFLTSNDLGSVIPT
jgi:hypothetical protein